MSQKAKGLCELTLCDLTHHRKQGSTLFIIHALLALVTFLGLLNNTPTLSGFGVLLGTKVQS